VLGTASCVKEPSPEELAQQTVVVTKVAPDANFTRYHTFAIGEPIDVVTEQGDGGQAVTGTVDPAIATPALDAIAAELTGRGYTRVDRTARPDLGVAVTAVVRLNAFVTYGAWWGNGSATPGYWGGGSSLSTGVESPAIALWLDGALVIELYDLHAADGTIRAVWAAFIYGVIRGVNGSVNRPPGAGLEQAFTQSPYLRETP
jgi:hypothetical protein